MIFLEMGNFFWSEDNWTAIFRGLDIFVDDFEYLRAILGRSCKHFLDKIFWEKIFLRKFF